jgi:hypothetical protein
MISDRCLGLALIAVSLALAGASSADEPELRQAGTYRIRYRSSDISAELDYRWAATHPGDEWLVLKLSLADGRKAVTAVESGGVTIRTPEGHTLPLLGQAELRRNWRELGTALDRSDAWGPPSTRFAGSRDPCGEWFLVPFGGYFPKSTVYVSAWRYCTGPLVFQVPGGVQPGRWLLKVELEESNIRIPIVLDQSGRSE